MVKVLIWLFGTPVAVAAMIVGAGLNPIEEAASALQSAAIAQVKR